MSEESGTPYTEMRYATEEAIQDLAERVCDRWNGMRQRRGMEAHEPLDMPELHEGYGA